MIGVLTLLDWGGFEGRLGWQRHLSIVGDGRLEVCDGAHWAFVMKKSKAPPFASRSDWPPAHQSPRMRGFDSRLPGEDYNGPHECLSPLAQNLVPTKFNRPSVRAAWTKSTVQETAGLAVMLPPRSCRKRLPEAPNGCGDEQP